MILNCQIQKKAFNEHIVLENTEININGAGIIILEGDNGAGKTTLLSILSGTDLDYKGVLSYNGEQVNRKKAWIYSQRYITYCPQDALIFEDLSIIDNILFPYEKKDREKAKTILYQLGLEKVINHDVKTLSDGEKQRLAIARAFYADKEIILLDECTTNLDKESTDIILSYLNLLSQNHIIIFVSHDNYSINNLDDAFIYQIKDKKINLIKTGKLNSISATTSYIKHKSSILKEGLFLAKPFPAWITFIFTLFMVIIIFFDSMAFSFSTDNNSYRIFEEYINSAQAISLRERDNGFIAEDGTSFVVISDMPYIIEDNIDVGSRIIATLGSNNLSFFNDKMVEGQLPKNPSEFIISSACADKIQKDIIGQDVFSVFPDFYTSGTIVGIYEADINPFYPLSKELTEDMINIDYALSYGFFSEAIFTCDTNEINKEFVLPTDENVKSLTYKDVYDFSLYQDSEDDVFCPIEVNKEGESLFTNFFFTSTKSFLLFAIIFIVFLFVFSIVSLILFNLKNQRKILLLRVINNSQEKINQRLLSGILFPAILGTSLGYLLGCLVIISLNFYFSSVLISSTTVLLFPLVGLLLPGINLILFIFLAIHIINNHLSPKDISKLIYEIKKK